MPVIDMAVPDGCCGIQGDDWRRLTDEDFRDAMRRAVAVLDSLGCSPASAAIGVGRGPAIDSRGQLVDRTPAKWG
jgi:hypothetical protein